MKPKPLILLASFIMITAFSAAQSSFPSREDNPRWRIEVQPCIYPRGLRYFIDYYIEKDTIIEGLNYSAIIVNSVTQPGNPYSYRVGYIRAEGKKVFYRQMPEREEFLLYDFGLNTGDTCQAFDGEYRSMLHTVLMVDTILVNGNQRRRLLVMPEVGSNLYWIEGIGSLRNPIEPYRTCVSDQLRCLSMNGETVYLNPNRRNCDSLFDVTQSIVNSSMLWSDMKIKYPETGQDSIKSYYVKFSGDTVGDYNNPYVKVWKSSDSAASNWELAGTIREESYRTWFKSLSEIGEHLLYDFSVTLGTLVIIRKPVGLDRGMKVTGIDTIDINGGKQLRIQLVDEDDSSFTETWIEKIGSLRGILNSCYDPPGWENKILCVRENEKLLYRNEAFPDCFYQMEGSSGLHPLHPEDDINIYPNPGKHRLYFRNPFDSAGELNVRIFNCAGNIIYQGQHAGTLIEIDVAGAPGGICFVQISYENKAITKKIVID